MGKKGKKGRGGGGGGDGNRATGESSTPAASGPSQQQQRPPQQQQRPQTLPQASSGPQGAQQGEARVSPPSSGGPAGSGGPRATTPGPRGGPPPGGWGPPLGAVSPSSPATPSAGPPSFWAQRTPAPRGPRPQQQQSFPPQVSQPPQQAQQPVQRQPTPQQPAPRQPAPQQQPAPQPQQAQRQPLLPTPQPRQPPPQQQGVAQVTGAMKQISIGQIPRRKQQQRVQKSGIPITVETNHLEISIKNPNMIVVHYDVAIEPEKPYRFYRPAMEAVRKKCFPSRYPAFDGRKNLYSFPELPFTTRELVETVKVYDDERQSDREVTVTIKFAASVDISAIKEYMRHGTSTSTPQEALQVLDVVFRQLPAQKFVTVGRSFFTPPPGRIINLGNGMDLWYGFFQSAIVGWKPFLNIDVAHKGFPTPMHCVELLENIARCKASEIKQLQRSQEQQYLEHIKGLKVVCEIPNSSMRRVYKVHGLEECPSRNKFIVEEKDSKNKYETTVERYYLQTYRYRIKFPNIPCLKVGPPNKAISVPMELCSIQAGQVTIKKLNEEQTRAMIKEAAVDTDRRKDKIYKSMQSIGFNSDPCLKEFGLSVAESFTKVAARILKPPTVDYRDNNRVKVDKGVWRMANTSRFLTGAKAGSWCILNASRYVRENDIRNLAQGLTRHGQEVGIEIAQPADITTIEDARRIEEYFKRCEKDKVAFVVIILPDRGVTYAKIKKMAELQVGVLTQCLKTVTVQRKLSPATFVNILLKINAKLNGVNHNITRELWPQLFQRPVMVVGADVTHPSPGQINVPSIAAVAASHDPKAFKYNMIWKLQAPKEEVIRDLESIMMEQLLFFYRLNNKVKPERILFYRDGVSEGQFRTVLERELTAIRGACSKLESSYKPQITFLVVQKRHHTRFFPTRAQDADGRNKNVPAGTIVDSHITHPTEIDFYLVSHASIQGTARPTKYHLLWDDADLSEQELAEITYYLCHLFARCTRSVSIPAPTYYAHLAAFRARSYTEPEGNQSFLNLDDLLSEQKSREIKPTIRTNNPMFFV